MYQELSSRLNKLERKINCLSSVVYSGDVPESNYLGQPYDEWSFVRSNLESGIYKTIEWFDPNNALRKRSVLSGGTAPEFTTRTVTFYKEDGTTLLATQVYTLVYAGGELISETLV